MKKKILAVMLTLIVSVFAFTSCSSLATSSPEAAVTTYMNALKNGDFEAMDSVMLYEDDDTTQVEYYSDEESTGMTYEESADSQKTLYKTLTYELDIIEDSTSATVVATVTAPDLYAIQDAMYADTEFYQELLSADTEEQTQLYFDKVLELAQDSTYATTYDQTFYLTNVDGEWFIDPHYGEDLETAEDDTTTDDTTEEDTDTDTSSDTEE
jgi:hypothetical protein